MTATALPVTLSVEERWVLTVLREVMSHGHGDLSVKVRDGKVSTVFGGKMEHTPRVGGSL